MLQTLHTRRILVIMIMIVIQHHVVAQQKIDKRVLHNYVQQQNNSVAHKETYGGSRWFNYGDAMDTSMNFYHMMILHEGASAYNAYTASVV